MFIISPTRTQYEHLIEALEVNSYDLLAEYEYQFEQLISSPTQEETR